MVISYRGNSIEALLREDRKACRLIEETNRVLLQIDMVRKKIQVTGTIASLHSAEKAIRDLLVIREAKVCPLCGENCDRPYLFTKCRHRACTDCVRNQVLEAYNFPASLPLKCPEPTCDLLMSLRDIQKLAV